MYLSDLCWVNEDQMGGAIVTVEVVFVGLEFDHELRPSKVGNVETTKWVRTRRRGMTPNV